MTTASFRCGQPHNMKLIDVFKGDRISWILGIVAFAPFWMFPILFAIAWNQWIPIWPLEVVIVSTILWPPVMWMFAARRKVSTVWVWRRHGHRAVLSKEPWLRDLARELPAQAGNWRKADTSDWTWVIDTLDEEKGQNETPLAREFTVLEYEPPAGAASDELVSLFARSEASLPFYSAKNRGDRYIGLKIAGFMVLLGVIPFLTWLAANSLTKTPAAS